MFKQITVRANHGSSALALAVEALVATFGPLGWLYHVFDGSDNRSWNLEVVSWQWGG